LNKRSGDQENISGKIQPELEKSVSILRFMPDGKRSTEGALEPLIEILRQPGWQQWD
jgi:hypothetical protein